MNDKVRPKKALGQHFLTDKSVARCIASTLDAVPGLPVLEVGPGMGMLTQFILEDGRDLMVAEIDSESIGYLNRNFPELDGRIIEGDFLEMDLNKVFPDKPQISVIGNYPYNISSQIFFHILDYRDRVVFCSGMLQREVAERLAAAPGTKTRGILSVLLQAWYDVEYLFTVGENMFNPPPKVKSGVVRLARNGVENLGCDERLFRTVVKTTFGQRRKTIRNSVKPLAGQRSETLMTSPLMGMRPEQLSVEQFVELTNLVEQSR